jgi:formate hydrogenlyase subunit 6/NADH:ubiquinone oxidoreductase subunit I
VMFVHRDVSYPIKCDFCWKCTEVCNTGAIVRVE